MICDSCRGVHNLRSWALRSTFQNVTVTHCIFFYKVRYGIQSTVAIETDLYKGWVGRKTGSETNTNRRNQVHNVQGLNDLDLGTFSGYNWQINVLLLSPSQITNTNIKRCLTKKHIHQNPLMLDFLRGFLSFDLAHDLLKYCFDLFWPKER